MTFPRSLYFLGPVTLGQESPNRNWFRRFQATARNDCGSARSHGLDQRGLPVPATSSPSESEGYMSAKVETRFPSTREMARQIGTALKKVQLRKDLHTVLARSVVDAREQQGIGPRAQEASEATPIAELVPEIAAQVAIARPKPQEQESSSGFANAVRGLQHYLPFFKKKK